MRVYSYSGEARPWRAVTAAVAALIVVSSLAFGLSRQRAGDVFGPRITPEGWDFSFTPPARFDLIDKKLFVLMEGYDGRGRPLSFSIFHLDNLTDGSTSPEVARALFDGVAHPGTTPGGEGSPEAIGDTLGVELISRQRTIIVRGAVYAQGKGIGLVFQTDGRFAFDASHYTLFDEFCRTVEFDAGGAGK